MARDRSDKATMEFNLQVPSQAAGTRLTEERYKSIVAARKAGSRVYRAGRLIQYDGRYLCSKDLALFGAGA
jgi:hypothetical protein